MGFEDKNPVEHYQEQALDYLYNEASGITLIDIPYQQNIYRDHAGLLPASLPYDVVGPVAYYSSIEDHDANATHPWRRMVYANAYIEGNNGLSCSLLTDINAIENSLADLSTQRFTVTYRLLDDNSTEILFSLDGTPQYTANFGNASTCEGKLLKAIDRFRLILVQDGPPGFPGTVSDYPSLSVNGHHVIATGGEQSNWSQVQRAYQQLLDAHDNYPLVINPDDGSLYVDIRRSGNYDHYYDIPYRDHHEAQDALNGGLLYAAQSLYYARLREESSTYALLKNTIVPIRSYLGVISTTEHVEFLDSTPFAIQPGGLLIDIKGIDVNGAWKKDQAQQIDNDAINMIGHTLSSLEHEVWQELTGFDAISTVRGIQWSREKNVDLVTIIKDDTQDTWTTFLQSIGFEPSLPSSYDAYSHNLFGQHYTSWIYNEKGEEPGFDILRFNATSDNDNGGLVYTMTAHDFLKSMANREQMLRDWQAQDDQLKQLNVSLSHLATHLENYTLSGITITKPDGFGVKKGSIQQDSNGHWQFTIEETKAHSKDQYDVHFDIHRTDGPLLKANVGTLNYTGWPAEVTGVQKLSGNGFSIKNFKKYAGNLFTFDIHETTSHPDGEYDVVTRINYGTLPNIPVTIYTNLPTSYTISDALVTSPSGFSIAAHYRYLGDYIFLFQEDTPHSYSDTPPTIQFQWTLKNNGKTVSTDSASIKAFARPELIYTVTVDTLAPDITGNYVTMSTSNQLPYTTACGDEFKESAKQLLTEEQHCFESIAKRSGLNVLSDDSTGQGLYRSHATLNEDDYSLTTLLNIQNTLYSQREEGEIWEYLLPHRSTKGSNYLFDVYIATKKDAFDNIMSQSYTISHQGMANAGGGYVVAGKPLIPALDKRYDNRYFNDQLLVGLVNNDSIRTPSTLDPVSTVTGNRYHDEVDVSIPTLGFDLVFSRTYNALPNRLDQLKYVKPQYRTLGPGWFHSFGMLLISNEFGAHPNHSVEDAPENGDGIISSITYLNERGGEVNFLLDDTSEDSQPTAPEGIYDTLRLNTPTKDQHTLTFRNGTRYVFEGRLDRPDKIAQLAAIHDPFGHSLTLRYNSEKQLTRIADSTLPGRGTLTLAYHYGSGNERYHLKWVKDWTGRRWTFAYHSGGLLASVTNPLGEVTTYDYDEHSDLLSRITSPQDRGGQQATMAFRYYANGQALDEVNTLGARESLHYDLFRQRTRVINPRGNTTIYDYDTKGRLRKLEEPDGTLLRFEHTKDGHRWLSRNALGHPTHYSFHQDRSFSNNPSNTFGQITREQDALGYHVDYHYDHDLFDQVTQITDKNGHTTYYDYYSYTDKAEGSIRGKLAQIRAASAMVNGALHHDIVLMTYRYHADGRLHQITEFIDPAQPQRARITTITYEDRCVSR